MALLWRLRRPTRWLSNAGKIWISTSLVSKIGAGVQVMTQWWRFLCNWHRRICGQKCSIGWACRWRANRCDPSDGFGNSAAACASWLQNTQITIATPSCCDGDVYFIRGGGHGVRAQGPHHRRCRHPPKRTGQGPRRSVPMPDVRRVAVCPMPHAWHAGGRAWCRSNRR